MNLDVPLSNYPNENVDLWGHQIPDDNHFTSCYGNSPHPNGTDIFSISFNV